MRGPEMGNFVSPKESLVVEGGNEEYSRYKVGAEKYMSRINDFLATGKSLPEGVVRESLICSMNDVRQIIKQGPAKVGSDDLAHALPLLVHLEEVYKKIKEIN